MGVRGAEVKDDTGEEAAEGHAELLKLDKDVILHPEGNGDPTGLWEAEGDSVCVCVCVCMCACVS